MFSYSFLKHIAQESKKFVRYKNPPHHWSVARKKVQPVDKALNHFDDFYKQVFNKRWTSIRTALLGIQKYVCIVNSYGDDEETMSKLELNGALNMRTLFKLEKQYIEDETLKKKRKKALETIIKSAQEVEQENQSNTNEPVAENVEEYRKNYSLANSLDNAQLDDRRLIDTSDSMSSEILYEFVPATKIKGREEFIFESSHYKMYEADSQFTVKIEKEYDIHFPENLNIYCYEKGNTSDFPPSKMCSTGVFNYYLMDGGSVLPILALDLTPGCKMLDMCAAPGGKSLLALQTLYPQNIVSNDISKSRLNRIDSVYDQFLFDYKKKWLDTGRITLSHQDGRDFVGDNFDRILVDVPCTTDRHSLHENNNNIFKPSRIKERLQIPELQRDLLFNALKLVRKGGIVVYSTCSLSPIQNDGVVNMALKKIWEETNIEIVVKDLTPALLQTRHVYELADEKLLKYGNLVLPTISQNYGPMYFCKLQRVS